MRQESKAMDVRTICQTMGSCNARYSTLAVGKGQPEQLHEEREHGRRGRERRLQRHEKNKRGAATRTQGCESSCASGCIHQKWDRKRGEVGAWTMQTIELVVGARRAGQERICLTINASWRRAQQRHSATPATNLMISAGETDVRCTNNRMDGRMTKEQRKVEMEGGRGGRTATWVPRGQRRQGEGGQREHRANQENEDKAPRP